MEGVVSEEAERDGLFAATRWTLIREAAATRTPTAQSLSALSELCNIYWRPVYLFLRRQGMSSHDAEDVTQGFFTELLSSRFYANADQAKGRFRSFLLGALKHFRADALDRERSIKRGGGWTPVRLDVAAIAEAEAQAARSGHHGSDREYDREWAEALMRQVMARLEHESRLAGNGALFRELRSHLTMNAQDAAPYAELAARLSRSAVTLRSDVARLRARYRAILREEVRGTVADPKDVDEELQHLRQALVA